ncbi:DUF4389 domain-containing protein [Paeniglutamicibacter kerguelensis]|uniref:DUF4389 domain-containing protein n=1 Tax=Paeniglutamicibacter kerguelensis TaxID=254788 RepID=A0ABS4XAZ7_9MICC|nr:DUF4389 domain-containing protein [Paeniglutamicibacter kerguelensis]MBP2385652.1 hypothetical protein [Paeniglutamicibacter kerguelensis]
MTVNPTTEGTTPGPGTVRSGVAGAVVALVMGVLLALVGLGAIIGGIASTAVLSRQGPDGYLSTPMRQLSAASYALTSPPALTDTDTLPFNLGSLRLAAESTAPGGQVFIGIGPKSDVDRYLGGVHTTEITGVETSPFRFQSRDVPGAAVPSPPSGQDFWAASASGPGIQQVTVDLPSGDWVVVIMNADAGAGITANVQAAVRSELFGALNTGLWIGGIIALVIGAGLIALGAILLGRRTRAPGTGTPGQPSADLAARKDYPARLSGHLDPQLSRWLWLVKWLLAVPHFIILFFLWFAVIITTIISGFAILFTGRYPRPLFEFAVGVLRWSWRVSFYAYSALATDKYPPFTLASTGYPADFDVEYPEKLSHGLVLVKWWLLAIPQLLIVSVFTGSAWSSWNGSHTGSSWDVNGNWSSDYWHGAGFSLLGILVLIAAFMLLFTGRYQRPLFDLVMGINRWIYRVLAYTLLLRDEYPPFRLDQGPDDPAKAAVPTGPASPPPNDAPQPPLE